MMGLLLMGGASALAQAPPPVFIPPPALPNTAVSGLLVPGTAGTLRLKATPDECYNTLGTNTPFDYIQVAPGVVKNCLSGQRKKTNQGYVWGAAAIGTEIWFGTTANPECIVSAGISDNITPYETQAWACEYGTSPYSIVNPAAGINTALPPQIGDLREPRMYVYNTSTRTVLDITPRGGPTVPPAPQNKNPQGFDGLLRSTRGLRAVAQFQNTSGIPGSAASYVLSMGPGFARDSAGNAIQVVNVFAFRADTKKCVAKATLSAYDSIRRFVNINGVMYTAAAKVNDQGGAVLRVSFVPPNPEPTVPPSGCPAFITSPQPLPTSCSTCFVFTKIFDLDGEGAYLAQHSGRLFVSTWPKPNLSGVWMSPTIPTGGLTSSNAAGWKKVFKSDDYEPDPVIRAAWGMGQLFSFGGYLYWGTMMVPYTPYFVFSDVYGPPATPEENQAALVNTFRTAYLMRGRNFDTTPDIELVYGNQQLPVYTPPANGNPGNWALTDNNLPQGKKLPLFGPAGFGQPYTNYIWSMNLYQNKLFIGTMDWSFPAYMATQGVITTTGSLPPIPLPFPVDGSQFGADLYSIASPSSPAVAETLTGAGNHTNYGFRNLLLVGNSLYTGMANPMNLLTNTTDTLPEGGWEMIEIVGPGIPRPR